MTVGTPGLENTWPGSRSTQSSLFACLEIPPASLFPPPLPPPFPLLPILAKVIKPQENSMGGSRVVA
ncbi:hypothetical protein E2C01_101309 [Portunus trituberculatus]|uniref:Uncharacterized protein n=1 Tax=Portunus trituberculatus TaxID=210409 RepID=A0A5B7KEF6_PORTR|nr:hypothetical protein [Portunus trituberculatus]